MSATRLSWSAIVRGVSKVIVYWGAMSVGSRIFMGVPYLVGIMPTKLTGVQKSERLIDLISTPSRKFQVARISFGVIGMVLGWQAAKRSLDWAFIEGADIGIESERYRQLSLNMQRDIDDLKKNPPVSTATAPEPLPGVDFLDFPWLDDWKVS